jgi:hypothetical protein
MHQSRYARVPADEQTTDPQIDALRAAGCATILREQGSAEEMGVPATPPGSMGWSYRDAQAQGLHHAADRVIAGLGVAGQRLV